MFFSKTSYLRGLTPILLILLDMAVLLALYAGVASIRYAENYRDYITKDALLSLWFSTILVTSFVGAYSYKTNMATTRYIAEYSIAFAINVLVALLLLYFVAAEQTARGVVGLTLIVFPMPAILYRRILSKRILSALTGYPVLVIGAGEMAQNLYHVLKDANWPHPLVFVDMSGQRSGENIIKDDKESPTVYKDVAKAMRSHNQPIEMVILASRRGELSETLLEWMVSNHFMNMNVYTIENFYAETFRRVFIQALSPYWVFEAGFALNHNVVFERIKRGFDLIVSGLLLIGLLPLMMLLVLLIRLDSPGPAIFKQRRIGHRQNSFTLYKFRSMRIDSDEGDKYTREGDRRITRLGAFLRKTRLDELPQLWNVFKGEMSLIGPRAEWDELVSDYEKSIPFYHFRHLVKPGITGWAQVNYNYGENLDDTRMKLGYDLYYVRHYSLLLDLTICLKTLYIILWGRGR